MKLSEKMDTNKSHQLFINIISYFFVANQLHTLNCLLASFIFRPLYMWLWKFTFYFFLANQLNPW